MKKYFAASLMKNGLLGGGLVADSRALTYHTGKATVPQACRHLEMKYEAIARVSTGWLFLLPTVRIEMRNGDAYQFVVFFGPNRLVNTLKAMGVDP